MPDRPLSELISTATRLAIAFLAMGLVLYTIFVDDFSKIGDAATLFLGAVVFTLAPTNLFALFVQGIFALLGSSVVSDRMGSRAEYTIVFGVFLYTAMNLVVKLVFPPF